MSLELDICAMCSAQHSRDIGFTSARCHICILSRWLARSPYTTEDTRCKGSSLIVDARYTIRKGRSYNEAKIIRRHAALSRLSFPSVGISLWKNNMIGLMSVNWWQTSGITAGNEYQKLRTERPVPKLSSKPGIQFLGRQAQSWRKRSIFQVCHYFQVQYQGKESYGDK